MLATGLGACSQELHLYKTLVLFVIYFVLKMFKNIDFYIKTRCTRDVHVFFLRARMTKSSFVTEKLCKVRMSVFEIVAHPNVDNWTQ